jgi:NADH-quinone oxidoreductase subunit L
MMMGLGVGGVAVGMFHLITHAFFKALLFLGAGSVIHGCSGEQDIRRMGGLRKLMPVTFATYAAGMLALCGVPFFSGFWSKDEILHAAHLWNMSRGSMSAAPFYMGAAGALLTAFYMTRQVYYVFFGERRASPQQEMALHHATDAHGLPGAVHESPAVMTGPLVILAIFAALLGFIGTPAWPWFQGFLDGRPVAFGFGQFAGNGIVPLMVGSSIIVFAGLALGWWLYGRRPIADGAGMDALERLMPGVFHGLGKRLYVDEFYDLSVVRVAWWMARLCSWMDRWVWNGVVQMVSWLVTGVAWADSLLDTFVVNTGFDEGCKGLAGGGRMMSRLQNGRVQSYLRVIGIALVVFAVFLFWGRRG